MLYFVLLNYFGVQVPAYDLNFNQQWGFASTSDYLNVHNTTQIGHNQNPTGKVKYCVEYVLIAYLV